MQDMRSFVKPIATKKARGRDEMRGEPGGIRTRDPLIKSQVLYRLSYGLGNGGEH
jgi:hypothetical protein